MENLTVIIVTDKGHVEHKTIKLKDVSLEEVEIRRHAMKNSDRKIVITDASKFIKTSTYNEYNNIWLYESYSEIIVCRLLKELKRTFEN